MLVWDLVIIPSTVSKRTAAEQNPEKPENEKRRNVATARLLLVALRRLGQHMKICGEI